MTYEEKRNWTIGGIVALIVAGLLYMSYTGTSSETNNNTGSGSSVSSVSSSASSASSSSRSSSSVRPQDSETKKVVLVDHAFGADANKSGYEKLVAMGVKRLKGDISDAQITVETDGRIAVGMYYAPATQNGSIDAENEWKRFPFINATWKGVKLSDETCARVLNKQNSEGSYDASSIPLSDLDACGTGSTNFNLESAINENGSFVGFLPVGSGSHVKVTLHYKGNLSVSPLASR